MYEALSTQYFHEVLNIHMQITRVKFKPLYYFRHVRADVEPLDHRAKPMLKKQIIFFIHHANIVLLHALCL